MVSSVYSTLGELTVKRSLAVPVVAVNPLAWPTTSSAWGAMLIARELLLVIALEVYLRKSKSDAAPEGEVRRPANGLWTLRKRQYIH